MTKLRMQPTLKNVSNSFKNKTPIKIQRRPLKVPTHPVLRIRIHMDPFHFGKPKPDPDSACESKSEAGSGSDPNTKF
jgi:hypothetical protein